MRPFVEDVSQCLEADGQSSGMRSHTSQGNSRIHDDEEAQSSVASQESLSPE